jgi:hypothetical protein
LGTKKRELEQLKGRLSGYAKREIERSYKVELNYDGFNSTKGKKSTQAH